MNIRALVIVLALPWAVPTVSASEHAYAATEQSLLSHVRVLSSDLMQGRRAGSEGYRQAAEYAASVLADAKVQTLVKHGGKATFLQMFEIPVTHVSPPMQSFNVVGTVQGEDPKLLDEYVLIGAHLDGLGIGGWLVGNGSHPGIIHNGANDNATGVAVVLELARAFSATPAARSLVFALWSAEEVGWHGVKYFITNPPIDLRNALAYINLDGVGRSDRVPVGANEIYALGASELCGELGDLLEGANRISSGFNLDTVDKEGWFEHGDQYQFHLAGVPSVLLTDLGSDDYHRPTDDVDEIDAAQLLDVYKLVLALTDRLANDDRRICRRQIEHQP